MPEVVTLVNRSHVRNRASPKFSATLLNVDLKQDVIPLVLDLLSGICNEFTRVLYRTKDTVNGTFANQRCEQTATNPLVSSALHLVVGRLNLLVLLSKRLLLTLEPHGELRHAFIRAVFYVLRLAIWSHNRSVRCAALRCLRYYLHTSSDVRLFLDCRLDLLVARSFDLSYLSEPCAPSSQRPVPQTCPTEYRAAMTSKNQPIHLRLPDTLNSVNLGRDTQQLNTSPAISLAMSDWSTNPLVARTRRTINPRLRSTQQPNSMRLIESNSFGSLGNLPSSPLVSPLGERQLFIRLSYDLVRLAPRLFPLSLIQALSAPCLRAGRFLSGGWDANKKKKAEPIHLAHRFRQPDAVNGRAHFESDAPEELQSITNDIALRSCLLIIAELIILAPEHIQTLSIDTQPPSEHSTNRPSSVDELLVQVLMTTFACSPDLNTVHSARVQEAVLLVLLNLMNSTRTLHLLPIRRVTKFLVPFTRILERPFQIKSVYDNYPSFTVCAKISLLTMLRSWSGLLYFMNEGLPCLEALMYSLAVGTTEMRDQILELLFGLFQTFPLPHPSVKQMEPAILGLIEALASCAPSTLPMLTSANDLSFFTQQYSGTLAQSSLSQSPATGTSALLSRRRFPQSAWDLEGGFVASEGCRIFAKYRASSNSSIDLMDSYNALLLATLVQAGLYEGLIRAISDPNETTSIRAGLLLGLLACKACTLFPHKHPLARRLHTVGLLQPRVEGSQLAVVWLERVHRVMHAHEVRLTSPASLIRIPLHSPFLECLARQSTAGETEKPPLDDVRSTNPQASESWIDQIVAQSGVVSIVPGKTALSSSNRSTSIPQAHELPKHPDEWDWDLLTSFGRHLFELNSSISWEDKLRLNFLHRLMDFITPNPDPSTCRHPNDGVLHDTQACRSASIPNPQFSRQLEEIPPLRLAAKGHSQMRGPKSFSTVTNMFAACQPRHESSSSTQPGPNVKLAWLPHTWTHASSAAILAAGLVPHLALYASASDPGRLLTRFLTVVRDALTSLYEPSNRTSCDDGVGEYLQNDMNRLPYKLFQPAQLRESCSSILILAVGQLTCSEVGESRLETSGLCSIFHSILLSYGPEHLPSGLEMSSSSAPIDSKSIVDTKHHTNLMKLLFSSLNFTRPNNLSQHLLTAAVNGGSKPLRIYALQLIRLLFRLRLPFLSTWCIDLVVKLCLDVSCGVSRRAFYLLEELCLDAVNVQAVTRHVLFPATNACQKPDSVVRITPFGYRLLSPNTGPVGHRIFCNVLSRHSSFNLLIPSPSNLITNCPLPVASTIPHPVSEPKPGRKYSVELHRKTQTPIDWLLDVSRSHYNLAYASELDKRLNALFTAHLIPSDPGKNNHQMHDALISQFAQFAPWQTVVPEQTIDAPDSDSESDDLSGRPSNLDHLLFEGFYDAGVSRDSSAFLASPNSTLPDSMQWLPLPKHIYASLSEHAAGLDMILQRGDLHAALLTLNLAVGPLCTTSTMSNDQSPTKDARQVIPSRMDAKAALWALAHVGSATCGQSWFANQPGLLDLFKRFSISAESMGLRITAWLCLNLLTSKAGGEKLLVYKSSGSTGSQMVWTTTSANGTQPSKVLATTENMTSVTCLNGPNNQQFSVLPSSDALLENSTFVVEPSYASRPSPIAEKREMNGLGMWKVLGRHSSSLSRAPRWLPRKAQFLQKQFSPAGDKPPSSRKKKLSDSNPLPFQPDTNVVQDKFAKPVEPNPTDCNVMSTNNFPMRSSNYYSATWTHRDLLTCRRSINCVLQLGSLKLSQEPMEYPTEPIQLNAFNRHPSKPICLPMELSALGHKLPQSPETISPSNYSSVSEPKRFAVEEDSSNSVPSQGWLRSAAERVRSLFSFVHASTDANSVLNRYTYVSNVPVTTSSLPTVDLEGESNYQSDFLSPQSKKLSSLSPPKISVPPTDPVLSTAPPKPSLGFLNSVRSTPKRLESQPYKKCISRKCPGHCYGSEMYISDCTDPLQVTVTKTTRKDWCRQFFEIVTTSLANVTPSVYDRKLQLLVQSAAQQQREKGPSEPDHTEMLFDACVFTDLALLLATYTFPLRARVKIHSALMGLELYELLEDAKEALLELKQVVDQHPQLLSTGEPGTTN